MNDSYVRGFLIGKEIMNMFVPKKQQPLAYLYNGVRLPALPEWDREKYPYAVICYYENIFGIPQPYYLYLLSGNAYYFTGSSGSLCFGGSADGEAVPGLQYHCDPEYSEWTYGGEMANTSASVEDAVWANVNLEYDSTLYLAASTPIPIYNEPVNYLYNGVKLPKLPEWDREAYPYATIWSSAVFGYMSDDYGFVVTSAPLHVVKGTGSIFLKSTGEVVARACAYDKETETWKQLSEEATVTYSKSGGVRWANYDVLYADGTTCTEKSEPVPIYE